MNTKRMRQPTDDRGTDRIEAFSDGVIAVAITLLILDVHVPTVQTGLLQALLNQWPTYLGYVTSFLVITIFGANHHNMFRHIRQVDYALLLINAFFLIFIDLIYVLPIPFLRFGRPDMFSMGAQEAPEGHLPHTHAKHELPEVTAEPEGK